MACTPRAGSQFMFAVRCLYPTAKSMPRPRRSRPGQIVSGLVPTTVDGARHCPSQHRSREFLTMRLTWRWPRSAAASIRRIGVSPRMMGILRIRCAGAARRWPATPRAMGCPRPPRACRISPAVIDEPASYPDATANRGACPIFFHIDQLISLKTMILRKLTESYIFLSPCARAPPGPAHRD
jgi:hypothetical protein